MIDIVKLEDCHFDDIVSLQEVVYSKLYRNGMCTKPYYEHVVSRNVLEEFFRKSSTDFFGIFDGNSLVATNSFSDENEYLENYWFSYYGSVHPDFQGLGLYSKLKHFANLEGSKRGFEGLACCAFEPRLSAKILSNLGYVVDREFEMIESSGFGKDKLLLFRYDFSFFEKMSGRVRNIFS